jgi:hypothetical protein
MLSIVPRVRIAAALRCPEVVSIARQGSDASIAVAQTTSVRPPVHDEDHGSRRIGSSSRVAGCRREGPGSREKIIFHFLVSNCVQMRYNRINHAGRPWTRTHSEEGSMAKAKKKVAKKPAKKAAKKTAKKKTVKKAKKAKK